MLLIPVLADAVYGHVSTNFGSFRPHVGNCYSEDQSPDRSSLGYLYDRTYRGSCDDGLSRPRHPTPLQQSSTQPRRQSMEMERPSSQLSTHGVMVRPRYRCNRWRFRSHVSISFEKVSLFIYFHTIFLFFDQVRFLLNQIVDSFFVQRCPWTGTAIGKKNMLAFQCFVTLVFVCLVFDIILLTGGVVV